VHTAIFKSQLSDIAFRHEPNALVPPSACQIPQLTSLGGIKVESRNTYMGKDIDGRSALQEGRANHIQRQIGSTGDFIRVFPAVAEFRDTEPNVTHMLTITVVNRSDHVKRIRFVPPKLKQFALHQIPTMGVAPGLEVSADLEYFWTEDGDFRDEITVLCESDAIKVPVYAFMPRAELYFDSACVFGSVPPNSTNIRYIDVVNRGKKPADFEFTRTDTKEALTIEPIVGRLGPDGSDDCFIRVKVTFSPKEDLGVFRSLVNVQVNDVVIGERLDISAMVTRQVLEIVSTEGSGALPSLQFGTVYFGETRDLQVMLVNDGPEPAKVDSIVNKQDAHENEDPFWTIAPANGSLQPFEQRLLTVTYHPPSISPEKGFKGQAQMSGEERDKLAMTLKLTDELKGQLKELVKREDHEVAASFSGSVVSSADEIATSVKLIGRAVAPQVTLSQPTIEFIDMPTNTNTEISVKIHNHSDELPIVFETRKVSHFRARPSKGRLLPYQSQDLIITFSPAQRGLHKQTIQIVLYGSTGQQVGKVELMVGGNCTSEGTKTLLGGLHATDETFEPKLNFQGPNQLTIQVRHSAMLYVLEFFFACVLVDAFLEVPCKGMKFTVSNYMQKAEPRTKWERTAPWVKFPPEVNDVTVAYTFGADRFQEKKDHEDKYVGWLRGKYAERMAMVSDAESAGFALGNQNSGVDCGDPKNDPDYEKNALDLGLFGLPTRGLPGKKTLKEPFLALPVANEPLYLKHQPGEGPTYIKPKSKVMDENRLMLTKLKPLPTSKKERQECSSFLNPKQIMQISTHPSNMNFGPVCIQSQISKSFTLSNDTLQTLIVRIDTQGEKALERSAPESQVIPPGMTAGFDITLFFEGTATFNSKFAYIINEHHSFEVPVTAQAVPVMLNMSRDKISFAFPPSSNSMMVSETLYLINPSNNLAEYKIESHANFTPFPKKGTVEPMSQEEVLIYYKPGQTTVHEATLKVDVQGGESMALQCVGETDEGRLECKSKNLDFGSVAAGTSVRKALTLTARGDNVTVFFVDPEELKTRCPGLMVAPEKGMIQPGGNLQLVASVKANKPVKLDSYFSVQVRGGKNIKVPIKVDIDVPVVKIKEEEINFGAVYLGASGIVPLTIENISVIPAIFTLDLRHHPEFGAKVPDVLEYEEEADSSAREIDADVSASGHPDSARQGPLINFCVPPKTEGKIDLTYAPHSIENPAFELPLTLLGVSGKEGKALRRAVVAESAKPRLLLSTPSIDFGKRVIVNENMPNFSYSLEVTLTNCDDQNCLLDARLEGEDVETGMFHMADTTRDLIPGKSAVLKVHFIPKNDGEFRCQLRVFVDHNFDEAYFDLFVGGVGVYPCLGFDRREVFLPVTPVGQSSTVTFEVINYGFDNLDIRYNLPVDATTVPMTLKFPLGTMTNVVNTRVPVELTFSAKKSMSFATKIEFSDHNGNKYVLPVIGTTDASLLTVIPFLTLHKESLVIRGGDRPPYLSVKGQIRAGFLNEEAEIEMEDANATLHDKVHLLPPNSEFLCECKVLVQKESVKTLLDWANVAIFRSAVNKFPDDFNEERGKQIIEVIEASTGRTVPGQMRRVPNTRREEGQMLLTQYTEMLATLKAYGGLVNSIKPEYLLAPDLFFKLYLEKDGLPVHLRQFYQTHYQLITEGSWMMLIYQVVKLFVFNRLTPKLLRSTPGIDPALTKGLHLTGSNIYSPSELVLLGWLTYHYQAASPNAQVLNFESDLHDGRVLGAVIASHVPSLKNTMSSLKKTDILSERVANAQQIVTACRQIGLEYCPSATQIAQAPARDMMLFAISLFNTLPALIPRATIEFDGRLSDTVVRFIEISNPSGKPLVYSVRIEGDKAFACADSLRIAARDKIKFPVECLHKSREMAKAQIFFIGERVAGSAAGVTLVFGLQSSVKTFKRTEVVVKQTNLYEAISYEIPVKNLNAEQDTKISVSLAPLSPAPKGAGGSSSSKRVQKSGAKKSSVTSSLLLPDVTFWTKVNTTKLKRKGSMVLKINFLPLQLCSHSCLVFVNDDLAGETCYELQAKVNLPAQTDFMKFQQQVKSTIFKDTPVPLRNPGIDRCRTSIMELFGSEKGKEWFKQAFDQQQIDYKVEYLTECFSGPKNFSVYGPNAQPKSVAPGKPQPVMNNKLPLELRPMGPGTYKGRVILRSAFDVRVLDVEATVTAMGTRAELTFSCPARQAISQDIPIINHSSTQWVIQASLSGQYFTGPKEFQVPPMTADGPGKAMYTLTFAPAWISNVQGQLTLRNQTIGDSYQYELTGVGEDPVAENHIVIDCVARKRMKETMNVRNILGPEGGEYQVECDLLGISGKPTLEVQEDAETVYELNIMMPRGGNFTGSISFKAPNGHFIWYTLQVKAENPASEREIPLNAKARTAIIADIPITNPLDETVTFDVLLEGEGLIGEPSITIEPGSEVKYELIYSPLVADHSEGKLTFVNMQMGEFWYALHLQADEADELVCDEMQAELGKTSRTPLFVENPIPRDITFEVEVTNPRNFSIEYAAKAGASFKPGLLEVGAYEEAELEVIYTPTALDLVEDTLVILSHPAAGRWVYRISGTGHVVPNNEAPWDGKGYVELESMSVSAAIGHTSNNLLSFKNPLNRQLTLLIKLHLPPQFIEEGQVSPGGTRYQPMAPIHLLLSHLTVHLDAFQELEVPFLFCPTQMVRHSALVEFEVVEMDRVPIDDVFCFVYPIEGTAEAPETEYLGKFVTRAREQLDTYLDLQLSGVGRIEARDKNNRPIKIIDEQVLEPEHKMALVKSMSLKRDHSPEALALLEKGIVRYHLALAPLKVMRTRVQLKVSLEGGGRWSFDFDLVVNDADVDDVIHIEQNKSVSFHMKNEFEERVPFNAYFTPESSAEFTVHPEIGFLEPNSSPDGTQFVVSFRPHSYGKIYKGKLIVETEEMQWTYQVNGQFPKYKAPKNAEAKVKTQIDPSLDPYAYKMQLPQHRYVLENVAALHKQ
jgi:hypothetical protein